MVDGGSRDSTLDIARKFGVEKVIGNPLRTGEAGKALGVEAARNDIVALVDSDNILPTDEWLRMMVRPFIDDESVVGSEPLYYSYRRTDSLVTRYCSLVGMNDVLCLFIGNYDRYSLLTQKWTDVSLTVRDQGEYLRVELEQGNAPTIGANGFLVRRVVLQGLDYRPYLFDIDLVYQLVSTNHAVFAKVKTGIAHLFADSVAQYARKTRRRISDYTRFRTEGVRSYPWTEFDPRKLQKFILYTILLVPLFKDSMKGYKRRPDRAWLFHPVACWITLFIYGTSFVGLLSLKGISKTAESSSS